MGMIAWKLAVVLQELEEVLPRCLVAVVWNLASSLMIRRVRVVWLVLSFES